MKKHTHESGHFSWRTEGEIAVLGMEGPVYGLAVELGAKEALFSYFSSMEQDPKISALLLTHTSDALSDQEFRRAILKVTQSETQRVSSSDDIELAREAYGLAQYVMIAASFKKLLISGLRGVVASSFFGAHLASDIRVVSEDFVVEMSHIALDIPPDGGLGYFLPRYVGQGRATEILLSGDSIPAAKALELGLVHAIVPNEDFETHCLAVVRRFLTLSAGTISYAKEVLCPFPQELEKFLEIEAEAVLNALYSKGGGAVE
ncbi:hypothetical protein DRQ53_09905 [bacterium]|nr:MAG: hypothetical protein DRQ53_09905 [bacterium]